MSDTRQRAIDVMLAKQAIYDALCRYCRGIDRCDAEILQSAYWPDAYEQHGTFNGNAWEFAAHITSSMRSAFLRSTQKIGNVYIEVDDDCMRARCETYVTGYMQQEEDDGSITDIFVGGRYLDRFQRRGEEWRIIDRVYVLDWNRHDASTAKWNDGLCAMLETRGARSPLDPWDQGLPLARALPEGGS